MRARVSIEAMEPIASAEPAPDWQAPWMQEFARHGRWASSAWQAGGSVAQAMQPALATQPAMQGWRFVPQHCLPPDQAYETFIHEQRSIPTRDNFHDFFNALMWLHWPQVKQQLNRLQACALAEQRQPGARGPLRDAITVLDENGGLLLAPAALIEALQRRDWQQAFVAGRALWAQARLLPLGHAFLEKLLQPRLPLCVHLLCVPWEQAASLHLHSPLAAVDAWLASSALLQPQVLALKPFVAMPVAAVPGWHAGNAHAAFYANASVFRPLRKPE